MKYKSLLFDLDGTLTDSSEGVINGCLYALGKMGCTISPDFDMKKLIGPPFMWSFKEYFGLTAEESEKAIMIYREFYTPIGIHQNKVYDGIEDMLKLLKENGYDLLVATSKPKPQAEFVLEKFGLQKYISYVAGCPLNESGVTKADVIRNAFEHTKAKDKSEIVMIGDTHFDIDGATECGIDSIGVLYGMGGIEEFDKATYVVKDVEELKNFFIKKD